MQSARLRATFSDVGAVVYFLRLVIWIVPDFTVERYRHRLSPARPRAGRGKLIVVYYLLLYELVDDYMERRPAFRDEHLSLAREANERGELVLAGAYADPPDGAALVFRADDDSVVKGFVAHDPYVRQGLVRRWAIRQWTVVIGDQ